MFPDFEKIKVVKDEWRQMDNQKRSRSNLALNDFFWASLSGDMLGSGEGVRKRDVKPSDSS